MDCRFINLDAATERRAALERAFAENLPNWRLSRVQAVAGADAAEQPGSLSPAEKGCFLSHLRALESSLSEDGPSLILEDDVTFSPKLPAVFRNVSRALGDWDVLFAECLISDPAEMLNLGKRWPDLAARGEYLVLDLSEIPFAGSSAYFVSPSAKERLLGLLRNQPLDLGYDITLRNLARRGDVKVHAIAPFPVGLAAVADDSQIREDRPGDAALTAFRRSLFVDRDLSAIRASLGCRDMDENAEFVGAVFSALASQAVPMRF